MRTEPNTDPIDLHTPERRAMRATRRTRQWVAKWRGNFWLPCPVCGMEFGGHEWEGENSSIPDPAYPHQWGRGIGICPACTAEGRGYERPFPTREGEL